MITPDSLQPSVPTADQLRTARSELGEFCNVYTNAVIDTSFLAERLMGVAGAVSTIVRAHGQPEPRDRLQPTPLSVSRCAYRSPREPEELETHGNVLAAYTDASHNSWLQLQSPRPEFIVWASVMLPSDAMLRPLLRPHSQEWNVRAVGSFDVRRDRAEITYPFKGGDTEPNAHTTYFNLAKELGTRLLLLTA